MDVTEWKRAVEIHRQGKDEFFAVHHQSPIPIGSRSEFKGLDYFPPDPAYRFELKMQPHENREIIEVKDTAGKVQQMVRWGQFEFTIMDEDYTLQAYRSDPSQQRLFIPFRDATSGEETYGAGRYLDLEPDEHLTAEGKWVLDLNQAYNPWCAYSEAYVCPFVPPENWLKVAVRAGEKAYRPNSE